MKLCYQVATPDVAIAPSVTAYQGDLEQNLKKLSDFGYDGVEFMTINPSQLNWNEVKALLKEYNLEAVLVCTGEIFGQLHYSFTDIDPGIRNAAVEKVFEMIDFASCLGANVNIGRVRGCCCDSVSKEQTEDWAIEGFQRISDYAAPKKVCLALESVTIMQTDFINTIQQSANMVDRVKRENFKLMMDVFHMNIEEKNIYNTISKYRSYNIHVHLADNNRRYPGNCGMNFDQLIKCFYDNGYDGAFCTEIMQLPDQETAAKKSIEFLSPIFEKYYGRKARNIAGQRS
ncbi:sugar phosphate isomerase/epimerase family protein [Massiliimalia massiliensis]|uniref:sugar phosphate isomerase/epimerase family protein n=1 Tax=Massiliimalia massiliensis TaxID=1852384 RepID=UPI000987B2E0|nr:sugar phosphate isomerase/epimerase [Massiliimalia massiliensis]